MIYLPGVREKERGLETHDIRRAEEWGGRREDRLSRRGRDRKRWWREGGRHEKLRHKLR